MNAHCLASALLITTAGLWISERQRVAAQEQSTPATKSDSAPAEMAERITAIKKTYKERESRFMEELRAAKRDMPKQSDANQRFRNDATKLVKELITLLKDHGNDPAAFDGILLLVGPMAYPLDDSLVAIVNKHHLSDPKMGQLCAELGESRGGETWAEEILKAVVAAHPDAAVRGQATLSLGDYYRQAALWPHGVTVPDEQKDQWLAKARDFYTAVGKDFAELQSSDRQATLGEKAKWQLARLDNLPNLKVGKPAPAIVGEDLDGHSMKLDDFRGKVTVVVFWGSWCGPCMALVPHEQKLSKRLQDKPFVLVGVNCGDDRNTARDTVSKREMTWKQWWDRGGTRDAPIQIAYDVQHWPTIYVLDRAGVIRYIDPESEKLDDAVDTLLKEL
jgi:thiol-disulfide isomerase/thioredoxin